jgi:hypothetical protein
MTTPTYTDNELKLALANAIFGEPETKPFNFGTIDGKRFDILKIQMRRHGDLKLHIKVRTEHHGTHWYRLRLSEML